MSEVFNPLDMGNIANSIVYHMERMDTVPLGEVPKFEGAGIYAIYYLGDFQAYAPIRNANVENCTVPVYLGKAVPKGSRKGTTTLGASFELHQRLNEHARSIREATNLEIDDFNVRWLVIEPIWIPLGESAMIRKYQPVWNNLIDGFGNHDPGNGRSKSEQSRWDTLHPGRRWAPKYTPRREAPSQIEQELEERLRALNY